jgi:hypothetical protein
MASFLEKLRMNNIYPPASASRGSNEDDIFGTFMSQIEPMIRQKERAQDIMFREESTRARELPQQERLRQESKPPNVVYQPSLGDIAREVATGKQLHDINVLDPTSGYRTAQLNLRAAELGERRRASEERMGLSQEQLEQRKYEASQKIRLAEQTLGRKLDEREKLEIMQTGALARIGATGEEARKTADVTGRQAMERVRAGGEEARTTETVRQTGRESLEDIQARHKSELEAQKAGEPKLPTQQRADVLRRAEEARNTHPEWAKHIKVVPGGGFSITSPGYIFGPNEKTYEEMRKFIYEGGPTKAPTTEVKPTTEVAKPTGDTVRMRTPDGRVVVVPKGMVTQATQRGARMVK